MDWSGVNRVSHQAYHNATVVCDYEAAGWAAHNFRLSGTAQDECWRLFFGQEVSVRFLGWFGDAVTWEQLEYQADIIG